MSRRVMQEDPFSDFPTPGWCVDRLIDRLLVDLNVLPQHGHWLEPTAGMGGIVRRLRNRVEFDLVRWNAWEVQEKYREELAKSIGGRPCIGDARVLALSDLASMRLAKVGAKPYDVAITNPPYPLAFDLLKRLRPIANYVVMLLRVNFLSSEERQPYWVGGGMPLHIFQLPNRPKFRNGASDSTEYGWFVWDDEPRTETTISLLGLTPLAERKRWEGGK